MLKLSTHLAIWILMFLLSDAVTENKNHSNPQEKQTSRSDCKNDSNRLTFSNEILRLDGGQIAKNEHAMKGINEKTLLDYNGPTITKDTDIKSDQVFANYVRVKRSESTNNSLPYFWSKNGAIYASDKLLYNQLLFDGSYIDSKHKIESDPIDITTRTYSRHKRGILYKTGQRRKRVKGNTRHSKHRIKAQVGGKKRGVSRSSRKSFAKKSNSGRKNKNTVIDEPQTESKMKKRESVNSSWSDDVVGANSIDYKEMRADESETLVNQSDSVSLTNISRPEGQREENSVVLPFVHIGKAELRVRIEKITTDSSFVNPDKDWVDYSTTIGPSSAISTQAKYGTFDEIISSNVTNFKLASNFDYNERKTKETDNPIEFNSLGIKTDQNLVDRKYKCSNGKFTKFADEDMKYRAKRNQEIMSKRYVQSDTNAIGSKRFKNTGEMIGDIKSKRTMEDDRRARGNRAVRSIEEIKDLVEKLVVKVNELQKYVSNYSETPHTTDPCISKKAERAPRFSEDSNYKSKFVRDTSDHERLTNNRQAILEEQRTFQVPPNVSRVTQANSRSRRKSLRKWNRWTDWSSCSVTCGKGRQIRWRHCLRDCDDAEIEMEEKACQLPACPPGRFLGIF